MGQRKKVKEKLESILNYKERKHIYQNLWETVKLVIKGNLQHYLLMFRKEERYQVNNLSFSL